MTLCIGMKVRDGLVGLADTQVTSGTERITVRKLTVHQRAGHCIFLMTSGLRSIRDKAVTYFEDAVDDGDVAYDKLYKIVNAFAAQIRRVSTEDREAIVSSGLYFDLAALVGGQLERDDEHKLYLIYPQGNWVEVTTGTPYFSIGEGGYGRPLLDRALRYETSMEDALKIAYLAFDATITSSARVDFPLDAVVYQRDTYRAVEHRFERDDLRGVSKWWQDRLRQSIEEFPSDWTEPLFSQLGGKVLPLDPASGSD